MPNTELHVDQSEWLQKVDQSLHAIYIIGRKLISGRAACRNPGSELILIQQEVCFVLKCGWPDESSLFYCDK